MRTAHFLFAFAVLLPGLLVAQDDSAVDDTIVSAMSAGPLSISANAQIVDWNMNELRAGTNGWTCLPDNPDTPGKDPWCVNQPWVGFLGAYVNKTEPAVEAIGFAYMLAGDTPVSNSDPFATEPTGPEDWVTDLGPHLMMLIPDQEMLEGISTDHLNGGPWVMWPNTPYAHLMIPISSR
ncbi:MAG: hypothetical protein ACC655_04310 [Rhodothermia bacterium]